MAFKMIGNEMVRRLVLMRVMQRCNYIGGMENKNILCGSSRKDVMTPGYVDVRIGALMIACMGFFNNLLDLSRPCSRGDPIKLHRILTKYLICRFDS